MEKQAVTNAAKEVAKPHVLFILADDVGYADVGFTSGHMPSGSKNRASTPHLDALAQEGLVLARHYTHSICGPSRAAIQSGRLPIHSSVLNAEPDMVGDDGGAPGGSIPGV